MSPQADCPPAASQAVGSLVGGAGCRLPSPACRRDPGALPPRGARPPSSLCFFLPCPCRSFLIVMRVFKHSSFQTKGKENRPMPRPAPGAHEDSAMALPQRPRRRALRHPLLCWPLLWGSSVFPLQPFLPSLPLPSDIPSQSLCPRPPSYVLACPDLGGQTDRRLQPPAPEPPSLSSFLSLHFLLFLSGLITFGKEC